MNLNYQEVIVYVAVALALFFLYQKFFGKKKQGKGCDGGNCGCH